MGRFAIGLTIFYNEKDVLFVVTDYCYIKGDDLYVDFGVCEKAYLFDA